MIASAFLAPSARAAASFVPLGDLPGGLSYSYAWDVSSDGSTVVGQSVGAEGEEAFLWTHGGGMVGLGDLAGGTFDSWAVGVSGDGSAIIGESHSALSEPNTEAFRWTVRDAMVGLGDLPGGGFGSRAAIGGISGDGTTVAGRATGPNGLEAFRWSADQGMIGLGDLPGGRFRSEAGGISDDGTTIVGRGTGANGLEAFLWNSRDGMVGLGFLSGGASTSTALGVSADGSTVVGGSGNEAFRWTAEEGMVGLGDLPGGTFHSVALDVSADGSMIGGFSSGELLVSQAVIWDSVHGIRELASILTAVGLDLTGWTLHAVRGVSSDGRTLVGVGRNPSGETEGWLATLPEPGTGLLLLCGLVAAARKREVGAQSAQRPPSSEALASQSIGRQKGATNTSKEPVS